MISKNKINEEAEQKQTHTEIIRTCAKWKGLVGLDEKGKEIKNTYWWLQNSHGDVKYNTENIINTIVITMYRSWWVLNLSG